jgi:hypothetical protein
LTDTPKPYDSIVESRDKMRLEKEAFSKDDNKIVMKVSVGGITKSISYDNDPYTKHIRFINQILPRKAQQKLTKYGIEKKDAFLKFAEELADHNISARNSRVAKKLDDANIKEVNGGSIERTNDGFNGLFKVNTDSGEKKVKVQTILAWGDIQAPHYRTLIHIQITKGAKAPINNGGNMVQVKDKTGRILYTVEPQKRTNRRQVLNYIINALMFGVAFYGFMILWAVAEVLR